jgi:PKD repeat protein
VGKFTQTTTDYTLDVDKVTPPENDAFAPNDGFDSAVALSSEFTDAKVWGGESDFFELGLNESEGLEVEVTPASGTVRLRVYAPNRTELASLNDVDRGDTGLATVQAPVTGTYYVEVVGKFTQTTTEYQLRSNRTGTLPGPSPIVGDRRPTDPDQDDLFEDVNGDGEFGFLDVVDLLFVDFGTVNDDPVRRAAVDFDGNGTVDFLDVVDLLFEL